VRLAEDKQDGELYAIKMMNKEKLYQHLTKEQIRNEYKN
jgi:serine/threonine protein kinase